MIGKWCKGKEIHREGVYDGRGGTVKWKIYIIGVIIAKSNIRDYMEGGNIE